jgi:hypothetical protein
MKPFREDYGYPCRYTPTVCDGPVFRWGRDFEISASRNGVMVHGASWCMKNIVVDRLRCILAVALGVHEQLAENDRREVILFGQERVTSAQWLAAVSPLSQGSTLGDDPTVHL